MKLAKFRVSPELLMLMFKSKPGVYSTLPDDTEFWGCYFNPDTRAIEITFRSECVRQSEQYAVPPFVEIEMRLS